MGASGPHHPTGCEYLNLKSLRMPKDFVHPARFWEEQPNSTVPIDQLGTADGPDVVQEVGEAALNVLPVVETL